MKKTLLALLALLLSVAAARSALSGSVPDPAQEGLGVSARQALAAADELWEEGSFELARRAYAGLAERELDAETERWVSYRLADSTWRSEASASGADDSALGAAHEDLLELVEDRERREEQDRVWAEVQASLGDFYWTRRESARFAEALAHYRRALEWWGRSQELDLARERYLAIVWRMARPAWYEARWGFGAYGNRVPTDVLENAVRVALTPEDRSRARLLLAQAQLSGGGVPARNRAGRNLEELVEEEPRTEWHDDALFALAQWYEGGGTWRRDDRGGWASDPDYPGAVAAYRRLLEEYAPSATRYWRQAEERVRAITGPSLNIAVASAFLPGSFAAATISHRNLDRVDLALFAVDLGRDVDLASDERVYEWLDSIDTDELETVRTWDEELEDEGRHVPRTTRVELARDLGPGAYLLTASGLSERSRALVLVSDAAATLKAAPSEVLVWAVSAVEGRPLPGARVELHHRDDRGRTTVWRRRTAVTGEDGLARFPFDAAADDDQLFCAIRAGDHQAFAIGGRPRFASDEGTWRVSVESDRPAYRPGDEVRWKVVARTRAGRGWSTPANAELDYRVFDAQGGELDAGTVTLSEFGSAFGSFEAGSGAALGPVQLRLERPDGSSLRGVGSVTLCRLEEYRLPEFEVAVTLPEEDGAPRPLRPGDDVRAEVRAEYYFGGPVAAAEVEVVVSRRPFSFTWIEPRPYPFLVERSMPRPWRGGWQVVDRQELVTGGDGRAEVVVETDGSWADFEYSIEARVVDASRREVTGRGTVRVTRSPFDLRVRTEHRVHRPGEPVELELRAKDPNGRGVPVLGELRVTRERWVRSWRGPRGELRRAASSPGERWTLEQEGYESEPVLVRSVRTDADGEARTSFRPETAGAYRVVWEAVPEGGDPVRSETWAWVCDEDTRALGYRHGGLEILLDRDAVEPGVRTPVLLSVETPGRHVLFTVESEDLLSAEVVEVEGSVKLVWLDVTEEHVPNVWLGALAVHDGRALSDSANVEVPPASRFLDVELVADPEALLPGGEGRVSVRVRDADGEPVRAELSLAVVDEAVMAIQEELAPDPRAFFHGGSRWRRVRTSSTFDALAYRRVEAGEEATEEQARKSSGGRAAMELGAAAQAPAAIRSAVGLESLGYADDADGGGGGGAAGGPRVRSDFRKTAFWRPDVVTGADGRAEVSFAYPDSLTRWLGTARVFGADDRVGLARVTVRTRKPLMARLATPRFLQTGDEVVLSGVVSNRTEEDLEVEVTLSAEGLELDEAPQRVQVAAGADARVDRTVRVDEPGEVRLVLSATGGGHGDAVERLLTAHRRGQEVRVTHTTSFEGESARLALELPRSAQRRDTRFEVQVTPSIAVAMLDALPYLVDYPYGCTEQTLSRFLPAAVVARTLESVGLDADAAMGRVFGGIDPSFAGSRHAEPGAGLEELDYVTAQGLARLVELQHTDGGWGWWSTGASDLYMTGYALWGLSLAAEAGVDVPPSVRTRAAGFLTENVVRAELDPDLTAWCLHAVAAHLARTEATAEKPVARAFDRAFGDRRRLGAQGLALLALAADDFGRADEARVLLANLENGVTVDRTADASTLAAGAGSDAEVVTAHWGGGGLARRWSEGGVETTATVLRALLALEPGHELVEPTVLWLVRNRRGVQWSHTRETAQVVLALDAYLDASGELGRGAAFRVLVNGTEIADVRLTPDEVLGAPASFAVDPALLVDGENAVDVVRADGAEGRLHVAASATFFSTEEPIRARGHELFVRREIVRLASRPTLLSGHVVEREPLADGAGVASGDRLEVVVLVEAKSDLEYVLVEDWKPAGLETVEVKSGGGVQAIELRADELERRLAPDAAPARPGEGGTGRRRTVHRELRDRRTAFFLDRLPAGTWELRYELRAETPGRFHALPARGEAMYAPEIRGNGAEAHLEVVE